MNLDARFIFVCDDVRTSIIGIRSTLYFSILTGLPRIYFNFLAARAKKKKKREKKKKGTYAKNVSDYLGVFQFATMLFVLAA